MTAEMKNLILTVNCGSSSLKFGIYQFISLQLVITGEISEIGGAGCSIAIADFKGHSLENRKLSCSDIGEAIKYITAWLKANDEKFLLFAIGHRFVQGGPDHRNPGLLNEQLLTDLRKYIYLAPNHLPGSIKAAEEFGKAYPKLKQIACFDTAFHQHIPDFIKRYPLPAEYQKEDLIKYGFHGLSYTYVLQQLKLSEVNVDSQKVIVAHLGNGASMAAVKNGVSIDTTMGLSPIGGLVMGTRSGDLDPGVLLYLMKKYKLTVNQLDDLLSKQSGLKAIAGKSDMSELLSAEQSDERAREAITLFCYSARKAIGALAAAMGGLNLLVFTGGIGANSASIRQRICDDLDFLGISISKLRNTAGKKIISSGKSKVTVQAMKTNEEIIIAQAVQNIILIS